MAGDVVIHFVNVGMSTGLLLSCLPPARTGEIQERPGDRARERSDTAVNPHAFHKASLLTVGGDGVLCRLSVLIPIGANGGPKLQQARKTPKTGPSVAVPESLTTSRE